MMRLTTVLTAISIIIVLLPQRGFAALPPDILITELQVRSDAATGAADQEFVELYNTTNEPIDVSTWKLQYKSATGTAWNDKVTLHGMLAAHGHYLLVSDKLPSPPAPVDPDHVLALDVFSAGLSDSGGHVRIADFAVPSLPTVHDLVGWGTSANAAEGSVPATAPAGGKSLKRIVDQDSNFVDTDNNAADFALSGEPTPEADPLFVAPTPEPEPNPEPTPDPEPAEVPEPEEQPTTTPDPQPQPETPIGGDTEVVPPAQLLPPQITELLPNPASPATDGEDEYIELYNPNDQSLDLTGYKLQSGNSFSYSYTFTVGSLAAHEYKAYYVTETGDILSNTSGKVRLLDTNGVVVAETNQYLDANDGDAWALINGAWQWTTTPTPYAENTLTLPVLKVAATKTAVTATKKATSAKATTPKATTAKATTPKATTIKAVKAAATARQVYEDPAEAPPSVHPGILVGVGLITLVYAAYEYRHDAINLHRRFTRNRKLRRAARPTPQGR